MTREQSTWIAGVDGFKHRWFVLLKDQLTGAFRRRVVPAFADLLLLDEKPRILTVDIPIGLPDYAMQGGRACEREARKLLGRRASSIFSALGRELLDQASRADAHRLNKEAGGIGIGAQAFGLARKLREADSAMTPEMQASVFEVHPEICFWALNNQTPILHGKKTEVGRRRRQDVLIHAGFPRSLIETLATDIRVPPDDFLDACAALWTAERISARQASRLPAGLDFDPRGLDQAIWF